MSRELLIGDIHGCYYTLQQLLTKMNYGSDDVLSLTGDLVRKGPHGPQVLDWAIAHNVGSVLGNHDLYALMAMLGVSEDLSDSLTSADNKDAHIDWLIQLPFCQAWGKGILVHASVSPHWQLADALHWSKELEDLLQSDPEGFVQYMQAPTVLDWQATMTHAERLRLALYLFTRARYYDGDLVMLSATGEPEAHPNLRPWYDMPCQISKPVYFGHWAALKARKLNNQFIALDGGVVYGGDLVGIDTAGQYYRQPREEEDAS